MLALKRKGATLDPNYYPGFTPVAKIRQLLEASRASQKVHSATDVKRKPRSPSQSLPKFVLPTGTAQKAGVCYSVVDS